MPGHPKSLKHDVTLSLTFTQLDISADATAACEHVPHGNWPGKVWFAVVWNAHRHWQVQILLLDTAIADPVTSVPQPIWLMVELRLRRLEVERQLIVCTRWTEGLWACQFSSQWRGGEKSRAIWDGGGGGCCRHNVVVGVNWRETGCYCEVWLLLLRLRLFLLTAVILVVGGGDSGGWGRQGEKVTNDDVQCITLLNFLWSCCLILSHVIWYCNLFEVMSLFSSDFFSTVLNHWLEYRLHLPAEHF